MNVAVLMLNEGDALLVVNLIWRTTNIFTLIMNVGDLHTVVRVH